ncbi:MAG: glycosyltransferase [Patescibacteria group bacterium]
MKIALVHDYLNEFGGAERVLLALSEIWPKAPIRMYDFKAAQKVDYFIANSKNVAERIWKFYRRRAKVIYPPVELPKIAKVEKGDYYLVISRIVGGKGLDLAVKAAVKLGVKLKIAGKPAGYYTEYKTLQKLAKKNVEFLGYVSDKKLTQLYAGAKAFLALAQDEDFGMTPVEAMMMGTPVIAFRGGGYLESVVEGKTGVFFDKPEVNSLIKAIKKFEKSKIKAEDCRKQAKKFSKERFTREIKGFVNKHA